MATPGARILVPALLGLGFLLAQCNDAALTGGSGREGKSDSKNGGKDGADGADGETVDQAGKDGVSDGTPLGGKDGGVEGSGVEGGKDGGVEGGVEGGGDSGADGGGIMTAEECHEKKSGRVNVVLIFDNSGSQSGEDLASMRAGATGLLGKLVDASKKDGAPVTALSVVRFSSDAAIGANGWVESSAQDFQAKAKSDIDAATATDDGDTFYGKAFAKAAELWAMRDTGVDRKRHRNFIVFLTDGKPEDEQTRAEAAGIALKLVDTEGVAIIAVGTGGGLEDEDMQTLDGFAIPKAGKVDPKHKGLLLRAESQAEIQAVFGNVLAQLLVDPCT